MEKQCNAMARSCYFHIRNIGWIRPFISEDACKMLVNALVTSRLDYGNEFSQIYWSQTMKSLEYIEDKFVLTPIL
jgi:hypothetical protein